MLDNLEPVRLLVDKGAHVNFANKRGFTYLKQPAEYHDADILVFLLAKGACVDDTRGGFTPLQAMLKEVSFACSDRDPERVVRLLLGAGADPNITGSRDYRAPLELAVSNGWSNTMIELLLDYGAHLNPYNEGQKLLLFSTIKKQLCRHCAAALRQRIQPK